MNKLIKIFIIVISPFLIFFSGCNQSDIITKEKALKIANGIAENELKTEELKWKKDYHPKVSLKLENYKIEIIDENDKFKILYEYNNQSPEFPLWLGHPMHFDILVYKKDGKTELIGGR